MTFEQLTKANDAIRTTVIEKKNKKTNEVTKKDYAEVHQKIKAFRMLYPDGTISTELISLKDGVAIFKASALDDTGKLLGTGTAYEKEGSSFINDTSYIENCETSAVGRALAMCGIGIDLGVASYEEVANAKLNQKQEVEKVEAEVVKKTPKKKEQVPGYPPRAHMLEIIDKHFPNKESKVYKQLLEMNGFKTIEDATDAQLATLYNKFGGR